MIISTSRKRWSAFDQDGGKHHGKQGPLQVMLTLGHGRHLFILAHTLADW